MTERSESRALVKVESHLNCHISLPWFSFRRGDAPLNQLRRMAYAAHEAEFPKSPKRRLTNMLSWPLKAWRKSWAASSTWAAEAQADGAPSRLAQSFGLWWLAVRHNLSSQAYYLHKLWRTRPGVRPEDWLDGWDYHIIYPLFRDTHRSRILDDKCEFDAFCTRHGLPGLPIIAVVPGTGEVDWHSADRRLPAADLFVKPVGGSLGQGTEAYIYDDAGECWRDGDRAFDETDLLARIGKQASDADLMVQQRARNHPEIADLSPDALCTLRCVTYRFQNESACHFRSVLRMGRQGRIVDHAVHGGLVAAVGDGGLLCNPRDRYVTGSLDQHPDTGADIAGRSLPQYQAMQALALRAHDAIGIAGLVSWDIALIESGPVLVEGNSRGHLDLVQMAHDEPLGLTDYVAIVERLIAEQAERG